MRCVRSVQKYMSRERRLRAEIAYGIWRRFYLKKIDHYTIIPNWRLMTSRNNITKMTSVWRYKLLSNKNLWSFFGHLPSFVRTWLEFDVKMTNFVIWVVIPPPPPLQNDIYVPKKNKNVEKTFFHNVE